MPEYRRMDAPGGTFFLTWVTHDRRPLLQSTDNVARLRAAVAEVRQRHPFELCATVILPDHVHFLWEPPPGDSDFSKRVGMIKVAFTRALGQTPHDGVTRNRSRQRQREAAVWQRRFWEHTIRDETDLAVHMDYVHYNPVKHGLASCPHAWPYSSFGKWVSEGRYDADWACCCRGQLMSAPCFDAIAERVGE